MNEEDKPGRWKEFVYAIGIVIDHLDRPEIHAWMLRRGNGLTVIDTYDLRVALRRVARSFYRDP